VINSGEKLVLAGGSMAAIAGRQDKQAKPISAKRATAMTAIAVRRTVRL